MFKKAIFVFSIFIVFSVNSSKPIFAQDVGTPVFKKLAFYSFGGALVGSFASILIWATDPLNPDVSFKEQLLIGFGAGTIVGFLVGATQLINDQVPTALDYPYQNYSFEYSQPKLPTGLLQENRQYVSGEISITSGKSDFQISGNFFQARF